MPGSLTPLPIAARAIPRATLLPFGFAARFFLVLTLGFLWLIPAWWSPSLLWMLMIWDALALAIFVVDLSRLPAPSQLEVSRSWSAPLTLGHSTAVQISIQSLKEISLIATLIDDVPSSLRDRPPVATVVVPPAGQHATKYSILARTRGPARVGAVSLRYRGPLGFAERWATAPIAQTVSVLPDLLQAQTQTFYVLRTRQPGVERRKRRYSGFGREFESLRDYRDGDELRDVSWTATARRRHLITRTYEAARSQPIWIVVDAGRLLRAQIQDETLSFSKLDYSVNAALSIAQVALGQGDQAGLLAYGRNVQQLSPPARGAAHLRAMVESLSRVQGEIEEADHALAVRTLLRHQTRRALIVWITDFAETAGTPDVIDYAVTLARRHLVLFAALTQPDLAKVAHTLPQSETAMFQQAAALELVERRDVLLRNLRRSGVLALDLAPAQATGSLVNEYLRIKDRNLI